MNRILIVPGLHNSGSGHWQTEWEQRLPYAHRIELPDWKIPNIGAWVGAIENAIEKFSPTHIVAHSFGTLASAVVVAKASASSKARSLRGLFFVAPADPDKFNLRDALPSSTLAVSGILIGSLTDPWLSWQGAQRLGKQWNLRVECAGDAGHINTQSGHGAWLEGWQSLHTLLQTS